VSLDAVLAATLEEKAVQFLVSAGEASGDMYAAGVTSVLSDTFPDARFFGCAGPRLQKSGVKPVLDARSLAVVGLAEVLGHLPRIYGEFRKLTGYVRNNRPDAALLTDNPDFNLRLARHLKRLGVPVFYLVAPQVWAWRQSRAKLIARLVDHLFCIFPFEEQWFRDRGVQATYIGHPLAHTVRPSLTRDAFFARYELPRSRQAIVLLPGSRSGEARRHLPVLFEAVQRIRRVRDISVLLATPKGFISHSALATFREPIRALSIKVIEDETPDCIAHSDLALAASGTVTIEAAILGTPMITFYKVMPLSWYAGRHLVKVPFFSMVNLIADRKIVPELIQAEMTADNIASSAVELLSDDSKADFMRRDLLTVRGALTVERDPFHTAAALIAAALEPKASGSKCKLTGEFRPSWALNEEVPSHPGEDGSCL